MVSTNRLFVDQALERICAQQCVDWAVNMLMSDVDTPHVRMLAAQTPPYNHFELAALRDQAFRELSIQYPGPERAVTLYTAERLQGALVGNLAWPEVLFDLRDIDVANGHSRELQPFYLLAHAYEDLMAGEEQWYWDEATRDNILKIVREQAVGYLSARAVV